MYHKKYGGKFDIFQHAELGMSVTYCELQYGCFDRPEVPVTILVCLIPIPSLLCAANFNT